MKVLMTADAVGGVWTYALELCRAVAAHGADVALATMGPCPTELQRTQATALANVTLHTSSYRLEWMDNPWDDVERAGEWLLELAATEKVDLIHLNGFAHAALPWRKPVVIVAHSCVYSWWHAVHGTRPPSSWEHYRRMVERGLAHATTVVTPTRAFIRELRQSYTFETPVHVISNARAPAPFLRTAEVPKEPLIFASGRLWDEAKNLRVLDVAARRISWPVFVAGDTRSPDGRAVSVDALHCVGRQSEAEIARWLQRASIFVHPARYEPFGLAVLEAAHAHCALVLSDIPTLREVWGDAALFVDANGTAELEHTLCRLIDAPEERARLGRLACQRAAMLSIPRMGEQYLALYRELLHRPAWERSVA
jgi:glycosyltransferase involved in cell wall biosynthesis